MRKVILLSTIAAFAFSTGAQAADMSGPSVFSPTAVINQKTSSKEYDWGGLYGGVHVSQNEATINGGASSSLASQLFPSSEFTSQATRYGSIAGGKFNARKAGLGAFIGNNWVDGDLVAGIELDYSRANATGSRSGGAAYYEEADGRRRYVGVASAYKVTVSDVLLAKARAGVAFDRVLPYAFLGLGIVRTRFNNSADGYGQTYIMNADSSNGTRVSNATNALHDTSRSFVAAGAAGVGVDWAVLDNVVLRAEYQYLMLQSSHGTRITMNTGKIGVAAKF